jgi:UTP-glucose-1-phosphate uridylyltransferase
MKPVLVVLAAGMGSRYGGLKQIDPVGPSNEIIIDYSIYDALKAGFSKVIFIIRKDIEKAFRKNIGSRFENVIKVEYAYQELNNLPDGFTIPEDRVKPWGTGHALLAVKNIVKEPFAVINSDDFYGREGFKKIADYLTSPERTECDYCMTGFILKNTLSENGTVARGVCRVDAENNLVNVTEMTEIERKESYIAGNDSGAIEKLTGEEYVSLNMWGLNSSIFIELEKMFIEFLNENIKELKSEFYLPFGIDEMIKTQKAGVKVLESNDQWFGITYKEDKPDVIDKVNKLVIKGLYPEKLF